MEHEKRNWRSYPPLFLSFLKIGLFTFGGGYAMIPLIQRETAQKRQWIKEEELLDIIAVAESTPGPIAVNCATFIGWRTAGVLGAICATLGVVLPSFVIIFAVSFFLRQFESLALVKYAFVGIRAGVLALVLKALISMFCQCDKGWFPYAVMIGGFLLVAVLKSNVLLVIASAALAGVAVQLLRCGKGGRLGQ